MFGYVRIYKDELKVKEYNLFKAYYCGLCQTLKKEYGFPTQYFLSYDATFLAVLLASLEPDQAECLKIRCLANPCLRRPALKKNEILSYAAAVNVLLVWFKLLDDWQDNRSPKALLLMPFVVGKKRKAERKYPVLYEKIKSALERLSALEQENCSVPDMPAGAFGQLMADVFNAENIIKTEDGRVLSHCGMLLGRFIYLIDAWADRDEDEKKKAYNPFLLAEKIEAESLKLSLEYTLGEFSNSLSLLKLEKNQEILNNIIYLGLRKAMEDVFADKETTPFGFEKEKHHERPL